MSAEVVATADLGGGHGYFAEHRDVYRDIFLRLGAKPEAAETLERAVEVSQAWIKGDYGHNDGLPVELDAVAKSELRDLCADGLGLRQAVSLPDGEYGTLLVFGASQFGNIRRSEQLNDLLGSTAHTFGRVVALGGERPLYPREVPGFGRLLARPEIREHADADEWLAAVCQDFDATFPEGVDSETISRETSLRFGETTQMRISMIAALGSVTLRKSSVSPNNATGLPVGVQEFEITPSSGTQSVRATVLHCPPHERKAGPSRHTTESCVGDLVEVLGVEEGERVAFIGAQPHIQRMKMTVDRSFRRAGRHDVRVYGTGPALDAGTPVEICASEVYKTLFELQQL